LAKNANGSARTVVAEDSPLSKQRKEKIEIKKENPASLPVISCIRRKEGIQGRIPFGVPEKLIAARMLVFFPLTSECSRDTDAEGQGSTQEMTKE